MFKVPNQYRIRCGILASDDSNGCNGFFILPNPFTRNGKPQLAIQASDGENWEHVSVSIEFRCPTWDEMCYVKNMFWDDQDTVIQFHPPKSEYVNMHKFCLHLWRPIGIELPMPDKILVGF